MTVLKYRSLTNGLFSKNDIYICQNKCICHFNYPNVRNAYFILAAINAMIREGIENTHTNTVYKKAKVAMAGKAKVYKILKMMCPVVKGRFSLGIRLVTSL